MAKTRWQHKVPQDGFEIKAHAIDPVQIDTRWKCGVCLKWIKRVPINDGPEDLKALLRF
jgi:hypothetical protein